MQQVGRVVALTIRFIADAATTILLPPLKPAPTRLKQAASDALRAALRVARTGERVSAIGKAVESEARRAGFAVVRELFGHGVGRKIHESPSVPNYEDRFSREMLTEGLVIAVGAHDCDRQWRSADRDSGGVADSAHHKMVPKEQVPHSLAQGSHVGLLPDSTWHVFT
jgi:methionine aminopeptidase